MEIVSTTVEDEDIVSLVVIISITALTGDKDKVEVDVVMEVLETETLELSNEELDMTADEVGVAILLALHQMNYWMSCLRRTVL